MQLTIYRADLNMSFVLNEYGLIHNPHDHKTASELKLEIEQAKFSIRHVVTLLVCLGLANMFILRTNLTMAIVEMMSNKTVIVNNETITQSPEFDWDSKTRGFVLTLFYYGYLATPLGGYIATRYGGVNAYGYGILITAILTIFTPFNLRLNFYWFVFCRIFEGVAEAISYTSIMDIAYKWAKPDERSKFIAFGFTGVYIGSTISFPLCGYLAEYNDWTAIFYGTGAIALFWAMIWFLVVPSDSGVDWRSTSTLCKHSVTSLNERSYPWRHILTCKSLWALSAARISYAWGYNIVILCFPLYLRDITTENTYNIGLLSAAPNFISVFTVPLFGCLIDYLISSKIFTATQAHKLYLCGSLSLAAAILISITFTSNLLVIVLCLVLFKVLLSFSFTVIQVMPLCIAPPYCSLISGIVSLWHTVSMIIAPSFIGFIVTHRTTTQWNIYFASTATVMVIGAVIFFIYASSEVQPWAVMQEEDEDDFEMKSLSKIKEEL